MDGKNCKTKINPNKLKRYQDTFKKIYIKLMVTLF